MLFQFVINISAHNKWNLTIDHPKRIKKFMILIINTQNISFYSISNRLQFNSLAELFMRRNKLLEMSLDLNYIRYCVKYLFHLYGFYLFQYCFIVVDNYTFTNVFFSLFHIAESDQ